jgi:hypothetical protein
MPTRLEPDAPDPAESEKEAVPVTAGYRRDVERPRPVQNPALGAATDGPPLTPSNGEPSGSRREGKKALPEIFRMPGEAAVPDPSPPTPSPSPGQGAQESERRGPLAPFGRMLKCELVDTLDSATSRSEPIVALVTQDLDWNGAVIIPAGTEAFGYARPEAVIDAAGVGRLVDTGDWTLVLPGTERSQNGRELGLRARALDRRETGTGPKGDARAWAIDDGADGLIGYTLSTLDSRETRLFAAAALGGMAQGMASIAERQQPAAGVSGVFGATQIAPTLGNAAAGSLGLGTASVANELAARIRNEIARRGVYVRVPAGKQFYLFVEQSIDPSLAEVGLKLPARRERGP